MINTFKPTFFYFHGNHTKKVHIGPIKKFAYPFHFNFWETPWSKINPSGPNGASKSAIPNFQVSMAPVFNFGEFFGNYHQMGCIRSKFQVSSFKVT